MDPKRKVITCPHCGYEYLPAEIFCESDFAGRPQVNSIVRDALGKIIYTEYEKEYEPEAVEQFICEHCGKTFIVKPDIKFKVNEEAEELDFSDEYVSLLDEEEEQ